MRLYLVASKPTDSVVFGFLLTHANRDYLGVISAIGAQPTAVERSVAAVRATGRWEIRP